MMISPTLIGLILSILLGAAAGYAASRIMDSRSSTLRNIVLGILGCFVGSFVFGLIGLRASGIIGRFIVSVAGACICIWLGRKFSR